MSLCTSFGTSLVFATEQNGALNMANVAGGGFRMYRVLDFGAYGSYDLRAEIRASENLVTAKGVTVGQMRLPSGIVVSESMVEVMFPAGPREIRSFMRATLKANTKTIPVAISTVYSPLTGKERDWTRKVPLQIRHSYVETPTSKGGKLAIRHATVIEACRVPAAPKSFSKKLNAR